VGSYGLFGRCVAYSETVGNIDLSINWPQIFDMLSSTDSLQLQYFDLLKNSKKRCKLTSDTFARLKIGLSLRMRLWPGLTALFQTP